MPLVKCIRIINGSQGTEQYKAEIGPLKWMWKYQILYSSKTVISHTNVSLSFEFNKPFCTNNILPYLGYKRCQNIFCKHCKRSKLP